MDGDEVVVEVPIRVEVAEFFIAKKILVPDHLDRLEPGDLLAEQDAPSGVLSEAMIRRAIAMATTVADTKRRQTSVAVPTPGTGSAASAQAVANALAPPKLPTVDVASLRTDVGLDNMPCQIQAEQDIFC